MFDLTDKIAVVTGADGNLGPIWCETLRKAGAKVYELKFPKYDVRVPADLKDFALRIGDVPDILICNQALDNPPGSDASFFGNFKEILDTNLTGTVNLIETFAPAMISKGGGNIVIIGSMLGFIASDPRIYPDNFDKPCAYGASKAGLWNLVNNCNMRFAKDGLIFNMLALSAVEGKQSQNFKDVYNERSPINRMLQKEDFQEEFLTCCNATVPYDAPLFVGGGYTIW